MTKSQRVSIERAISTLRHTTRRQCFDKARDAHTGGCCARVLLGEQCGLQVCWDVGSYCHAQGVTIIGLNDRHRLSFRAIADWLEAGLPPIKTALESDQDPARRN